VNELQDYRGLVFPQASTLVGRRLVGVDPAKAGLSLLEQTYDKLSQAFKKLTA
jgi:hypothetical protein